MTTPKVPTTESGRLMPTTKAAIRLLNDDLCDCIGDENSHDRRCRTVWLAGDLAAIEAEAAAAAVKQAVAHQPTEYAVDDHETGDLIEWVGCSCGWNRSWLGAEDIDGWWPHVLAAIEGAK
jgi:hypothetical protein